MVVQNPMSMQGMADLYRIKPDLLERLIKSTIEPLESAPLSQSPLSHYIFDGYLFDFLLDRDRSRVYYCAPMLQHIHICRHFFSLLDGNLLWERSWVFRLIWALIFFKKSRFSYELSDYAYHHFYDHLCAATTVFRDGQNFSDDHPAVEILHHLETAAYYVDGKLSDELTRYIIQAILRWADMLYSRLKVGAPYVLWFLFFDTIF